MLKSAQIFFQSKEVPLRDRIIIAVIIFLIVSPVDLIPESIPILGIADDLCLIAMLYDYAFRILPRPLALQLFQGSPDSFRTIERNFSWLAWLRPAVLLRGIWKMDPKQFENHPEV